MQTLPNIATIFHAAELELDPPGYDLKMTNVPTPRPSKSFGFRLTRLRRPRPASFRRFRCPGRLRTPVPARCPRGRLPSAMRPEPPASSLHARDQPGVGARRYSKSVSRNLRRDRQLETLAEIAIGIAGSKNGLPVGGEKNSIRMEIVRICRKRRRGSTRSAARIREGRELCKGVAS